MDYITESRVERYFQQFDPSFEANNRACLTQTLVADNYIVLGQLTALRFIEWVSLNPGGVVALPTGKTPEFFIKWLEYYRDNWESEASSGLIARLGIGKPDFHSLHFFQLDEFFPINPEHERSFRYFVKKYYIDVLGFDPEKTHLINTWFLNADEREALGGAGNLGEVFVDGRVDLSLRTRTALTKQEEMQQRAVRMFDQWCTRYEDKIRQLGGIGFFLGGIGPDGHIAFNVRGSSPYSHTRLTTLNYESQAAAAGDLGGISAVRKKAVVTMGLETITFNPKCVAVIIAAGQSKSRVVAGSVLQKPTQQYPATVLQRLPAARFFITRASATGLPVAQEAMPNASADEVKAKIARGLHMPEGAVILHTSPHHDDVELAYFPYLHHLVRSKTIYNYFAYCTSGYTSVTNDYLLSVYRNMLLRIDPQDPALRDENIGTVFHTDYQDDLTHYLRGIASLDQSLQHYAVARRLARKWIVERGVGGTDELRRLVEREVGLLEGFEAGRREPESFHMAKGWLREMEAELVWAHFGLGSEKVSHLRLPFYSDDIFPHYPDPEHDVQPIVDLLERIKPTIVSLALDPEGSGPDTHFKVLIALSAALDIYHSAHPEIDLRVWGYRNVWSRWNAAEVNTMIPVSLNSFAVIKNMFDTCYLSQRSADFPSYEHNGPFSELAQKVWVEQMRDVCSLLGEGYFYRADDPMLTRAYGMIYLKDMSYAEFADYMVPIRRLLEAKEQMRQ
ncbi:MAG: PIG-L family deacetylase [Bacteroidales bacterium]|nr:PIG-L family deacetylase [Bacteroidales bacterium]